MGLTNQIKPYYRQGPSATDARFRLNPNDDVRMMKNVVSPSKSAVSSKAPQTPKRRGQRGLSPDKRKQILIVARDWFVKMGYERANLDEVASIAECSKSTLYKYFGSKEQLFAAVIDDIIDEREAEALIESDAPMDEALYNFALQRLSRALSDANIEISKLIISEANRFPEVLKIGYEHGPAETMRTLTAYIRRQKKAGLLTVEDPEAAAEEFFGLFFTVRWMERLFNVSKGPSQRQLEDHVRKTVDAFLRLYRT